MTTKGDRQLPTAQPRRLHRVNDPKEISFFLSEIFHGKTNCPNYPSRQINQIRKKLI